MTSGISWTWPAGKISMWYKRERPFSLIEEKTAIFGPFERRLGVEIYTQKPS